jgi:hypothetical protein
MPFSAELREAAERFQNWQLDVLLETEELKGPNKPTKAPQQANRGGVTPEQKQTKH